MSPSKPLAAIRSCNVCVRVTTTLIVRKKKRMLVKTHLKMESIVNLAPHDSSELTLALNAIDVRSNLPVSN